MTNTAPGKSTLSIKRPGAATWALVSSLAGTMLTLTACGPGPDAGEPQAEREIVEYSPTPLGKFETREGAQLTFTVECESGDGSSGPVVAITELAPGNAPSSLKRLRELGATSLEAFLAVAPKGTEVPAVLRLAHEREASLLGRSTEVRELSLSSVTMLATSDSPSCDSYAAFTASVAGWADQTGSSVENHSLTFQGNGGAVAAKMCNYDSAGADYKHAQFCYEVTVQGSTMGLLYCEPRIIVPDGHQVSKAWLGATTRRVVRAEKLEDYIPAVTSFIAIGDVPPVP